MSDSDALNRAGADLREGLLVDTALDLIAKEGWRDLSLRTVAREAGVPLAELYRSHATKADFLRGFIKRIDMTALKEADEDGQDPSSEHPRDRLFDAIMLRFEALEPYREAVTVLSRELPRDPINAARLIPDLRRSLRWTLEAAGFSTDGVSGAVRLRMLGLVCWRTSRVWLDDGEDLARTMADLDRRLRRAERWLSSGQRTKVSEGDAKSAETDRKTADYGRKSADG